MCRGKHFIKFFPLTQIFTVHTYIIRKCIFISNAGCLRFNYYSLLSSEDSVSSNLLKSFKLTYTLVYSRIPYIPFDIAKPINFIKKIYFRYLKYWTRLPAWLSGSSKKAKTLSVRNLIYKVFTKIIFNVLYWEYWTYIFIQTQIKIWFYKI